MYENCPSYVPPLIQLYRPGNQGLIRNVPCICTFSIQWKFRFYFRRKLLFFFAGKGCCKPLFRPKLFSMSKPFLSVICALNNLSYIHLINNILFLWILILNLRRALACFYVRVVILNGRTL